MITLSKDELQEILTYLNEQPAKVANPLINFFQKKIQEQNPQNGVPESNQDINDLEVVHSVVQPGKVKPKKHQTAD